MQAYPTPTAPNAMYLIRLLGNLDARWLDYFADISIVVSNYGGPCVSTICMHSSDQATLMGILNSLYNFQYPILSLEAFNLSEATTGAV